MTFGIWLFPGLDALENLLEGTTKLQSQSRRHRRFEKNGDLRTAEKDFFSVNPRNVRNYSGQYGHTMVSNFGLETLSSYAFDYSNIFIDVPVTYIFILRRLLYVTNILQNVCSDFLICIHKRSQIITSYT